MKVQLERDADFIEINRIVIRINDTDFRITQNKFGGLEINKYEHGTGIIGLIIEPKVSNEIIIK